MRYSFEELKAAIKERTGSERINDNIKGYPLLHGLLIELRDDQRNTERWFKMLDVLLSDVYIDVNVRSKHGDCPLHSIVNEHDPSMVKKLLEILLKKNADPNLLGGGQHTPLELALSSYQLKHPVLQILLHKTEITDALKERCQDMLNNAIGSFDAEVIDNLLDAGLAYKPVYEEDRISEPEWFNQGVWLRIIKDTKYERETLKKREGLTTAELRGYSITNSEYTKYSPAVYVKSGLPVSSFGSVGLIIGQAKGRVIDYWYEGKGEELTRTMDFSKNYLTHGPHVAHQEHRNVPEKEMGRRLEEVYQRQIAWTLESKKDKHGILGSRPYYESMSWNEGLFRYTYEDIIGIFMWDKENIYAAQNLKRELDLTDVTFYHYDPDKGTMSGIQKTDF